MAASPPLTATYMSDLRQPPDAGGARQAEDAVAAGEEDVNALRESGMAGLPLGPEAFWQARDGEQRVVANARPVRLHRQAVGQRGHFDDQRAALVRLVQGAVRKALQLRQFGRRGDRGKDGLGRLRARGRARCGSAATWAGCGRRSATTPAYRRRSASTAGAPSHRRVAGRGSGGPACARGRAGPSRPARRGRLLAHRTPGPVVRERARCSCGLPDHGEELDA